MVKRITCLILSLIMLISTCSVCFGASAADDVMDKLISLVEKFPDGKYWNHMGSSKNSPDTWTNTPCASHSGCHWAADACSCNSFDNAIQCMGYAYKIAYELVGASARTFTKSTTLDATKLRVGDVIRYNGHSICVTGVKGNEIAFTDNNYTGKCKIRWSRMNLSSIKNFSYVLHHGKSGMKNSDLDFYTDVKIPDEPVVEEKKQEIWQMGSDALNIRASASTGATVMGTVPANARFYVYEKKTSDQYLWGKIKYGSVTGWSVLNYSEYVSGKYEAPEILNPKEKYPLGSVEFKWSPVSGADKYQVRVYDKDKNLLSSYNTTDTEYTVPFDKEGSYYAKVYSFNQFCDSWKIDGTLISFAAEGGKEDSDDAVDGIGLPESVTLVKGSSEKLLLNVTDAENYTWHSEDASVATVTADGEITANNFGKTKIGITSADGKTSAFCTVTVTPDDSEDFKQNTSKTTAKAIPLTWSAVEGATGYQVARYNSATKKYDRIAVTKKTSYTDKTVTEGKNYYYVVRAYVKTEQGYVYGEYVKIKCSSDPAKVTGLKQSASSTGTVTLKWNKVKNADVYTVYRYDSKTKKYSKIKSTTANSLKISQKAGSSYYYRVYAATKTEWGYTYGTPSDATIATAGPSKVSAKVANAGTGRVKISWSKVSGATHYEIYRYGNDGYTKIATVGAQYGSFTNINLRSNRNYYYRVRAVTTKNNYTACGSYSDKLTIKTK